MTNPIIGAPSVVGFGDDGCNNHGGSNLTALLLAQSIANGHCDLSRDINKSAGDNHVAVVTAQDALALQAAQANAEARQLTLQSMLEFERIANQHAVTNAQCCCEIKQLIADKACETNQLIRQIDADNAKLALHSATAELLAIKYSKGHSDK